MTIFGWLRRRLGRQPSLEPSPQVAVGEELPTGYERDFRATTRGNGRRAGILLHPTSLPGKYGIGELGSEVYSFLDWLEAAGCQCWQVLPLVPPNNSSNCPYLSSCGNSGNPLLISLDELLLAGLLEPADMPQVRPVPAPAPSPASPHALALPCTPPYLSNSFLEIKQKQ